MIGGGLQEAAPGQGAVDEDVRQKALMGGALASERRKRSAKLWKKFRSQGSWEIRKSGSGDSGCSNCSGAGASRIVPC